MRRSTHPDTTTTTATGTAGRLPASLCTHTPPCPTADSTDRQAAHTVASHPAQGWGLLCNGVLIFEDTGELLPDGRIVTPHRPTDAPAVDYALSLPIKDTHALVGGTSRSGKTNVAAAHKAAAMANASIDARLA